jgi:hypothetical protein
MKLPTMDGHLKEKMQGAWCPPAAKEMKGQPGLRIMVPQVLIVHPSIIAHRAGVHAKGGFSGFLMVLVLAGPK